MTSQYRNQKGKIIFRCQGPQTGLKHVEISRRKSPGTVPLKKRPSPNIFRGNEDFHWSGAKNERESALHGWPGPGSENNCSANILTIRTVKNNTTSYFTLL